MLHKPGACGFVIVGRYGKERVGAFAQCQFGKFGGARRAVGAATGNQHSLPVRAHKADQRRKFRIRQRRCLAGGPGNNQRLNAALFLLLQKPLQSAVVQSALAKRRNERGGNARKQNVGKNRCKRFRFVVK